MPRKHNIFGGGSQTNSNGLKFERDTSLDEALISAGYKVEESEVFDKNGVQIGLSIPQNNLYKNFLDKENINYKDFNSKKWKPDEAFFNKRQKTMYIIEKKYQETSGSVDEKLPNCDFKKKEYEKLFNPLDIKVKYIYVFNEWFKQDIYRDVLEYIKFVGCDYYFGEIPLEALGLKKED